jgi:hypothetical protein
MLIGVAWAALLGAQSPGSPLHDEITHYLIAREAWTNPVVILDVWGRPGNTLFYLLPSALELGTRRIWALAAVVLVVWLAARTAQRLGVRRVELVALAFWLQPWIPQLAFTSITQIPFMLALTFGIERWSAGKWGWASLAFGLLPLIRHEGLALTGVWLLVVGWGWLTGNLNHEGADGIGGRGTGDRGEGNRRHEWLRRWGSLQRAVMVWGIALLPMIVWNVLHYIALGRLASGNLFDIQPTDYYGSGGWLHFVAPLFASAGAAVVVLALLGVLRLGMERRALLIYAAPAALYFLTHTLIYRFGLFASGGYVLFLLPMAPTLALLAAFALERIPVWIERALRMVSPRVVRLALMASIFAAALLHSGLATLAVRPWSLQPNEVAMQEAADWLMTNDYDDTPVYSTHVWFFWVYEDRGNLKRIPGGGFNPDPADIPQGALVLWDRGYGDLNGISLEILEAVGSGFTRLADFGDGQAVLFRRD